MNLGSIFLRVQIIDTNLSVYKIYSPIQELDKHVTYMSVEHSAEHLQFVKNYLEQNHR